MFAKLRHPQEAIGFPRGECNDDDGGRAGTERLAQEMERFRFTSRVCDVSKICEPGAPHAMGIVAVVHVQ